jgi:hypothetical protein
MDDFQNKKEYENEIKYLNSQVKSDDTSSGKETRK